MRPVIIALVGAAIVIAGVVAGFAFGVLPWPAGWKLGVQASVCEVDSEIDSATRTAIADAANRFERTLLGDRPGDVYGQMIAAAQKTSSADALNAQIAAYTSKNKPFFNLRLDHIYYVDNAGSEGRIPCGAAPNFVSLAVVHGAQAHVVLSADSRNNGWALTLWLLPESGAWRVRYFHLDLGKAAGRGPEDLLAMARAERDSGHALNAALLYAAAQGTTNRGDVLQLPVARELQGDLAKFAVPAEVRGKPPFHWTMQGKAYMIGGVTVLSIGKELGIVFTLPQTDWPGDDGANARNHAFLDAFMAMHPDYGRVFAFLVARAMKPDNSGGFGTAYERGKGYDQ